MVTDKVVENLFDGDNSAALAQMHKPKSWMAVMKNIILSVCINMRVAAMSVNLRMRM